MPGRRICAAEPVPAERPLRNQRHYCRRHPGHHALLDRRRGPTSENKAWTSLLWFYVTADTGNPEDDVSGFLYSALIPVANRVTTPNCAGTYYTYPYPFQPHDSSIGIYDESGGEFTIDTFGIATGPAAVYCHVGPAGDPTGGTVTYLGKYTIDAADNLAIKVPFCGSGTQWVGIIASDGIIRYTGPVTIGSSAPPGIVTTDNNGQMTVQLENFPLACPTTSATRATQAVTPRAGRSPATARSP